MGAKIKTALIEIARLAVTLAAIYAFAVFFLSLESHAPQAPTLIGKGLPPSSSSQPAALLSHPIPYKAIVCQAGPGEPRRCLYYAERANGR